MSAAAPSGGRGRVRQLVAFLAALLCLEVAARFQFNDPVVYEPGVGYVNAPGLLGEGIEGWGTSHWTTHNVRARELPPTDGTSLLAIGDSFTEALMIPEDGAYTSVLEAELQKVEPGLHVINAGRSSQSSADYVALAAHYRSLFRPRHVIVQLRDSDLGSDAAFGDRTHFTPRPDGTLELTMVVPPERVGLRGLIWAARQRSMLVGYTYVRLGEFRNVPEPPLFFATEAAPPPRPPVETSYPLEAALDRLAAAYEDNLTILFVPPFDPDAPDVEAPSEARIMAHCRARKLSCVSLRPGYAAFAAAGRAPFGFTNTRYNYGHLNDEGHALAGRLLAASLAPRLASLHEVRP